MKCICVCDIEIYFYREETSVFCQLSFDHSVQSTVRDGFKGNIVPLLNLELCCDNVWGRGL